MSALASVEESMGVNSTQDETPESQELVVKDYRYQVSQRLKVAFPKLYHLRVDDEKLIDYFQELPEEALGLMHVYIQYYDFPLKDKYNVPYKAYIQLTKLVANVSEYLITKCSDRPSKRSYLAIQGNINSLNTMDFKIDQYIAKNREKAQNSYRGLKFKFHNSNYYEQDLQTMPILRNASREG